MTALRGTVSLRGPSAGPPGEPSEPSAPERCLQPGVVFPHVPLYCPANPWDPQSPPSCLPPVFNWLPGAVPIFPAPGFSLALPSPCPPRGLPLPQAQTSLSPDLNTTLVCLTSRQNKKNKNKDPSVGGKTKTSPQNSTSLQDKV